MGRGYISRFAIEDQVILAVENRRIVDRALKLIGDRVLAPAFGKIAVAALDGGAGAIPEGPEVYAVVSVDLRDLAKPVGIIAGVDEVGAVIVPGGGLDMNRNLRRDIMHRVRHQLVEVREIFVIQSAKIPPDAGGMSLAGCANGQWIGLRDLIEIRVRR